MAVRVTLATSRVTVLIDPTRMAEVLRGPQGPVYRRMIQIGDDVVAEARRRVGVSQPSPAAELPVGVAGPVHRLGRTRRPGRAQVTTRRTYRPHLRDTIVKRVGVRGDSIVVTVGSDQPHALFHHEGTRPHQIVGNPLLVFYWTRAGRVVAFRSVNHPGTRPNRFLTEAADVVISRL